MVVRSECDCWECDYERDNERAAARREEVPMTTQTRLTCTCASRYVKDQDHEGDCDLWLIDEFWAGFLAWDWDAECLVPTPKNPDYHRLVSEGEEYEWVNDYLAQKDERMLNGQRVEDVMLTTDAFIERMLANSESGVEDDGAWEKNADGMWVKTERYPNGAVSKTYSANPYDNPYNGNDKYDWTSYMSDRHAQTPLHMPDGETTVYGTSLSKQFECETVPDFALYLDGSWRPDGLAIMLPWRDYGLPLVSDSFADYAIKEAFSWAKAGAFVEVGCIGAHGRTGVVLACMAVLADPELTGPEAVTFVRTAYCHHAIETAEQEWWVERFHAVHHDLPVPPKPVYHPPAPTVVTSTTGTGGTSPLTSTSKASHSAGPAGDPNRKRGKARRSKRGGKRQQKHRNRMKVGSRT